MDGQCGGKQKQIRLDAATLRSLMADIRQIYLADPYPWVIGYSGGKDSTTCVQLVWYALSQLPPEQRTKRIYVISSDTLVETPVISGYITRNLEQISAAARREGMPFEAHKVVPKLSDTFWVNLIGRGYPAPSKRFRWCTERMKIEPANQFILDKVSQYGKVIVVLGVRKAESATRQQVMNLHVIQGSRLRRHTTLPNAFVFAPIEDFTTDEVWAYLLQVKSPWGNNNRDLVTLYRNASAGECPLVIDNTTPSCGNSRFGCWTCTVVQQDHSMESLVENGEDWMEPLLELRDFLALTQEPSTKRKYRDLRRRDGRVWITEAGKHIPGPYWLEVRKEILHKLLSAQRQVRDKGPDSTMELITPSELQEIRRIWRTEEQDWEDSVPKIYAEAMGEQLDSPVDDLGSYGPAEFAVLESICQKHEVPAKMVAKLLDTERQLQGMGRRSTVYDRIRDVLNEDWLNDAQSRELVARLEAADAEAED